MNTQIKKALINEIKNTLAVAKSRRVTFENSYGQPVATVETVEANQLGQRVKVFRYFAYWSYGWKMSCSASQLLPA